MKHNTIKAAFLLLFITLCGHANLLAAVIKGRVTDDKGEGLAFATVVEKGTTNGTSANGEGYYSLDLSEGKHDITAQYMGYQSQTKTVNTATDKGNINFKLADQSLEVKEVVIKSEGEDPAYAIMRKVIAKRKYHADLVKTFETDIYLKGALRTRATPRTILGIKLSDEDYKQMNAGMNLDSTGKGVVYLLEQFTQYSYKAPSKAYTKVISLHESGDPRGVGFATMPPITNIYDNNVQILGGISKRGFISPASGSAMMYYRYKFLGSYMDGDRMVNKIQVIPRRKFEPLFSGYVYVVDDEWVFQSVDLKLTKESQMDQLDTLRLEQTYIPVSKDVWVIQSQVIYPVIKLLGFDIAGSFITSYKNQLLNKPVAEEKFAGKFISTYDTGANSRTSEYWDTTRPIPLEADEVIDFHFKDSVYVVEKAKSDSMKKVTTYSLGVGSFLLGGPSIKAEHDRFGMASIINSIGYNTVEGLNATLKLYWEHDFTNHKKIRFDLLNRYGFSNTHYNPLLQVRYATTNPKWQGRTTRINFTGGQYVFQINNDNPITPFINELYTLIGGRNYMKIYESRLGRLNVQRDWANGFKGSLTLSYEQRSPLENTTDYTFDEGNKVQLTPNQPLNLPAFEQHNAAIASVSLSYQPGWQYIQYPDHVGTVPGTAPVFTARYSKGIPNLFDSKSDFDKWSIEMEHQLSLRLLGTVEYRLMAGGFLNDNYVGLPDMKHLYGNQTFLANPYLNSFQLAPYYRFSNTANIYGQGHVEWHLNGWLTNKIPGFRRLNWNLVGGSNALYIDKDNYYAEVFVGLENIGVKLFRYGRVDLVAGYESGKGKPSVGVRVGLGDALFQLLGISNGRGE